MFSRFIKWCYGNQSRAFFKQHKEEINSHNFRLIGILISVFTMLLSFLLIVSFILDYRQYLKITYSIFLASFLCLHVSFEIIRKKKVLATNIFMQILFALMFSFFIHVGTLYATDTLSVYAPAFFLITSFIVIIPMYEMIGFYTVDLTIVIVTSFLYKQNNLASLDVVNSVASAFLGITLGSGMLSSRLSSMKNTFELQASLGKDKAYQEALNADAISYFEFNVTKNVLTSGIYELKNDAFVDVTRDYGISLTISYSRLLEKTTELLNPTFEDGNSFMDRDSLLKNYGVGNRIVETKYLIKTKNHGERLIKQIYILSSNEFNDVMCFTITKDISSVEQETATAIRQMNITKQIEDNYDAITYIDLDNDSIEDYRYSVVWASAKNDDWKSTTSYFKRIEGYANECVVEADRADFLEKMKPENIISELENNIEYSFNHRVLVADGYAYYHIKIVRDVEIKDRHCVIMGFRNADEEVSRELKHKNELEALVKKADDANKAKTTFLFNMSHDIRTPMTAIIGFTQMAQKYSDNKEKLDDCLNKVMVASDHLLKLINEVLDMSRIESGSVTIEETEVNLRAFINKFVTIFKQIAIDKNIGISFKVSVYDLDVIFDEMHVTQIFMNIMGNAIKYTPSGGTVTLTIEQLPSDDDNIGNYRFICQDTGVGMSKEFLEHIFEEFSREKSTTTSGISGTGLGMAIVKKLIDLLGGTINIESEPGKGTSVTVNLTAKINKNIADTSIMPAESQDIEHIDLEGLKVLLVDDNSFNREIVRDALDGKGVILYEACDGSEAIEAISKTKKSDIDLVLMDIQMPKMDGYTASKIIRSLKDEYQSSLPIIAMTANAFDEDKQKATASGMTGHIAKPINLTELFMLLTKFKR